MAAIQKTSQWDKKRHVAFSHVAHLGVDNVLFALVRRWQFIENVACHKHGRDRERAKREARRKGAAAAAAAAAVANANEDNLHTAAGLEGSAISSALGHGAPCRNKSCGRREALEDKLMAKWEQIKTELAAKVKHAQKLRRSVSEWSRARARGGAEKEKKRDATVEEITALKEAEEGESAGVEEQKKRIQAAESEGRRILEESQRLEVELRKLRVRYQEETQQKLPMPHGSIISEADAWAKAAEVAAAALSDEDEEPLPPYVPDGLTVSFSTNGGRRRRTLHDEESAITGGGQTSKRPSQEHPGRFGRWGTEARERWSCCLCGDDSAAGGGDDDGNGGRRGIVRGRVGVVGGCEAVPPRLGPGGMTAADDVRLVWGRGGDGGGGVCGSSGSAGAGGTRREAWGAARGGDDGRELWRPMLATSVSGGSGGAAWSLIRQHRRPQTANARLMGRKAAAAAAAAPTTATEASRGGIKYAPQARNKAQRAGGVACGGGAAASVGRECHRKRDVVYGGKHNDTNRGGRPRSSARPGSAPPAGTTPGRNHNNKQHAVKNTSSSLTALRSARARAGWQRKGPTPVSRGGITRFGDNYAFRNSSSSSGNNHYHCSRGATARGIADRSMFSLNAGGSVYSVYSKGGGREAAPVVAAGGP
ncbi:unnamed protein product [Ectocarpus sp. CCAP 1310/34]|nr:unnamed protein product [Ectocarpus sp. CCAP 1310/34]